MRRISLIALAVMMVLADQAQTNTIDSLLKVLPHAKEDSFKVKGLIQLSNLYYDTRPDTVLALDAAALTLSQRIGWKYGEALSTNAIGAYFGDHGNYPKAMEYHLQCLATAEALHNTLYAINALTNIGYLYAQQENYRQAINYTRQAIHTAEEAKDTLHDIIPLNNISNDYVMINRLDSGRYYAQQAYELAKSMNDNFFIAISYQSLGFAQDASGRYEAALDDYRQGLLYCKIANDDYALCQVYQLIAKTFNKTGKLDSTLLYAKKSFVIAKENDFPKELLDNCSLISSYYKQQHNIDSAFVYLELAKATNDSIFSQQRLQLFQSIVFDDKIRALDKEATVQKARDLYEHQQDRLKNLMVICSLAIALMVFGMITFILYRSNRHKRKANRLLQTQKQQIQKTLAELKSAQAQLIQSEKMASLGELTAGIAHEIQNPLNFVNNFSEVSNELLDEMNDELEQADIEEAKAIAADIKQNLVKINHHGKRADAIVKGMLEHSRTTRGEKQLTDINALTEEYLRLAYHGLRAKDKSFNTDFKTHFDDSIEKINIIPQDIGRVLLNLFNNAFYAVNEKKKLLNGTFEPLISVTTAKQNGSIILKVSDNGNGIPQTVINKIYQPFFTTKPAGQGT